VAASITMPATASSRESSPLLLLDDLLLDDLLLDDLLLGHRLGRCCPVYPGGGAGSE